ncbi:urease accessory UreF family protein [Fluviibacterium sp. DFM31]|uniref:Urease accessory protein UreF n=1 Tax=Meridianimarinicoccus marinus TaxID=3231483 RepID=A0ABV3L5W3_9RHOB
MPIDQGVLTLTQWLSPAYPVGAFAYSCGLEGAVDLGQVSDEASLEAWLRDLLHHGASHGDALFLAATYRADTPEAVAGIDATARAFAPSRERLQEADHLGAAFAKITGAVWAQDLDGLTYPVAVGRAARLAGLPQDLTAAMYLQAMLSNLLAAAQRLMPLGQSAAQAMLHRLTPLCSEIAAQTAQGDLDTLSSTSFLADIASMHHETQYARIFRT